MANIALVKQQAELDRREAAFASRARMMRMQAEAKEIVAKAKARMADVQESSKGAIATNGIARVGGIALESYARRKLSPDNAKMIGPAATVGAIVAYTLGMNSNKASEQYAYFAAGGLLEGAASRFLIEQVDKALP